MSANKQVNPRGFTLIEVLVVIIIMATLFVIAIKKYRQTIVTARAKDAAVYCKLLVEAQRKMKVDTGRYITGRIYDVNTSTASCPATPSDIDTIDEFYACYVKSGAELAKSGDDVFRFILCDGMTGPGACTVYSDANTVALVFRRDGVVWRYVFDKDSGCVATGTDIPACPE